MSGVMHPSLVVVGRWLFTVAVVCLVGLAALLVGVGWIVFVAVALVLWMPSLGWSWVLIRRSVKSRLMAWVDEVLGEK